MQTNSVQDHQVTNIETNHGQDTIILANHQDLQWIVFQKAIEYPKKIQSDNIDCEYLLHTIGLNQCVRQGCQESQQELEQILNTMKDDQIDIQLVHEIFQDVELAKVLYYNQLRKGMDVSVEQIQELQSVLSNSKSLNKIKKKSLAKSLKVEQIVIDGLNEFQEYFGSIEEVEKLYIEQFDIYLEYQLKQNTSQEQLIEKLEIADNQSLKKRVYQKFQYNVNCDEFGGILQLVLEKKLFDDINQVQNSVNEQNKKMLECLYLVYVLENNVYQQFKQVINNNSQFKFLENSLIEKMEKMEVFDMEEIKEYPYLVVRVCQQKVGDHKYQKYLQNILDNHHQWVEIFKLNKLLLKFIFDSNSFRLNKKRIELLENYVYKTYNRKKLSIRDIYQTVQEIFQEDRQFMEQHLVELDQQDEINRYHEQYQQNFNFQYIKDHQHNYMILPFINENQLVEQGLEDFNLIQFRMENEDLVRNIRKVVDDKNKLYFMILTSLYGYIKRGEDLQCCFVQPFVESNIFDYRHLTVKYLQSYLLQKSDSELRTRLIMLMARMLPIPLVANQMIKYDEQQRFEKQYFPEISLVMHEGMGIFNFGVGELASVKCGKSQLFSNLIYPVDNQKSFLYVDEQNIMNTGTVDVFFENICQQKRNLVLMDGQGSQEISILKRCIGLSNVLIIHLNYNEVRGSQESQDVKERFEMLMEIKKQQFWIKVFVILRDCEKQEVVKSYGDRELQGCSGLEKYNELIDFCIKIPHLKNENQFKQSSVQISYYLNYCLNELSDPQNYRFTQSNYIGQFMEGTGKQEMFKELIDEANQFMGRVESIKENVLNEKNGLFILELLHKKRMITKELNSNDHIIDKNRVYYSQGKEQLKVLASQIQEQIQNQPEILDQFYRLVMGQHSILVQQYLSAKLKKFTEENVKDSKKKLQDLNAEKIQINSCIDDLQEQREAFDKVHAEKKQKKNKILDEIKQKQLSLESFWRCLFLKMQYTEDQELTKQFYEKLRENMLKGECLELIDGENLQFKIEVVKKVFASITAMKNSNIFTIAIIGKQSSGKSTLMNFCFGTQFMTSQGRCTSGVYLNLQKLPQKIEYEDRMIDYVLILDTEGLQSPEREDDEFDRMITTFAMSNSNLLICNSQGDFDASMKQILEICTTCLDEVKQNIIHPQIYFTFGFNKINDNSKALFLNQLIEMYDQVVDASPHLKETAEILKVTEHQVFVLGYAFESKIVEKNVNRNIQKDIELTVVSSEFSKRASNLAKNLFQSLQEDIKYCNKNKYKEPMLWLNEASNNWNVTDSYAARILQNRNLADIKNRNLVEIQYQLALKQIKGNVDESGQIKEVINQNHDMIKVESDLRSYFVQFRNYLQQIYDDAYKIYLEDWLVDHPRVYRTIINSAENRLQQQIQLYQKTLENKLTQRVVELQINDQKATGISSIRQMCMQIRSDAKFNELKSSDYQEYIKQVDLKFNQLWQNEIEKKEEQIKNNEMIDKQFQIIYDHFKQKQSQIPKLQFEDSILQDTEKYTIDLLAGNETIEGDKFDVNARNLQFVELDLKDRLFSIQSQYSENYIEIKKYFQKMYCYNYIDQDRQIKINQQNISKFICENIYSLYKIDQSRDNGISWAIEDIHNSHHMDELYNGQYKLLENYIQYFDESGFTFMIYISFQKKYEFKHVFATDIKKVLKYFDKYPKDAIQVRFNHEKLGNFNRNLDIFMKVENSIIAQKIEVSSDSYQFNKELYMELFKSDSYDGNILFKLGCQCYEKNIQTIEKNSHLFENKQTLIKYLDTFINFRNPQQLNFDRKTNLCNFMDKIIDWSKLARNMKKQITEILNVDENTLKNKEVVFHQFDNDKYEEIYQNVIKNEIEILNNELSQICGVDVTKGTQGLIAYCGVVFIVEQLKSINNVKMENQLRNFNRTKRDQYEVFLSYLCGQKNEITQANAQEMIGNVFQEIMKEKRASTLEQVTSMLKDPSYINKFSFKNNYEKMFRKIQSDDCSVEEKIKYFEDPTSYYQDQMADNETILNSYINNQQAALQIEGKFVLVQAKKYVQILQGCLKDFKYSDIDILHFFSFYKNTEQIELKQFENEEILNMCSKLFKLFMDILFLEIDEKLEYEVQFEIGNDQYKIQMKEEFRNIYQVYCCKIDDKSLINQQCLLKRFKETYYEGINQYQVLGLVALIDGVIKEIEKMEQQIEEQEFVRYQNDQLDNLKKRIIKEMKGCKYSCKFCKCQCQVGYHIESVKHSCDTYGHNLRVFAGGIFLMENKEYPSLQICNTIPSNHQVKINDNQKTWTQIQENKQPDFVIKYCHEYKARQEQLLEIWKTIGQQYCQKNNINYTQNSSIEYHQTLFWCEPLHIIFCLDVSYSVSGGQWKNIKNGSANLLKRIKNMHKDLKKCRVSVIFFWGSTLLKYSENIYNQTINEQIFDCGGGWGTSFKAAFQKVHEVLQSHYNSYTNHRVIFFTDGKGDDASQPIKMICNMMKKNSQDLKVNLYTVQTNVTKELKDILKNFNDAKTSMCKLEHSVDLREFEAKIVEIFNIG